MDQEKRTTPRQRTLKGAKIVVNEGFSTFECTVRNLSSSGARLKIASIIGIPDSFQLIMGDGRKFDCKVVWKTASELGVQFA